MTIPGEDPNEPSTFESLLTAFRVRGERLERAEKEVAGLRAVLEVAEDQSRVQDLEDTLRVVAKSLPRGYWDVNGVPSDSDARLLHTVLTALKDPIL